MQNYQNLLKDILDHGHDHIDRTGIGRRSIFGTQLRFDLSDGSFPLETTRFISEKVVIAETLMFIGGHTNTAFLNEHGVKIWDPWAIHDQTVVNYVEKLVQAGFVKPEAAPFMIENFNPESIGEIGPMYGFFWRHWPTLAQNIHREAVIRKVSDLPSDFVNTLSQVYADLTEEAKKETSLDDFLLIHYYSSVDQLNELILNLKNDPFSSRHVVTAFNPEYTPVPGFTPDENILIGKGCLMPCHFAFQCFVLPAKEQGGKLRLSLMWSQRSVDSAVGLPYNIASYALLLKLLAHCTDMDAYELIFSGGDTHLYLPHLETVQEQLSREPLPSPTLWLNPDKKDLFAFTFDDIKVNDYQHHPKLKYDIFV